MGYMSSISFVVLINVSASSFFYPTQGLRQGCPMSHFFFLMVAKGLRRAVKECKREGDIGGIEVGSSLHLTHLLFVDDVILFAMCILREAKKYNEMLDLYCKAIGMEVNINNSNILFNSLAKE